PTRFRPPGRTGVPRNRSTGNGEWPHGEATLPLEPTRSGRLTDGADVHLLAIRDDEVQDLDRRLVDVVLDVLRLPVADGEADEAEDGDAEAERGAVHGLGDALREHARLLARVDRLAGDGAERADQA